MARGGGAGASRNRARWQTRRGEPPEGAAENDLRTLLQKTITYLENNRGRMKYPEYRREGLPVTTAWRESLVKEMNYRVKGTEMFWNDPEGAEASCRCGPRPSVTMSGWRSTSGRARVVPSHVDPSRPSSQRKKSEADVHPSVNGIGETLTLQKLDLLCAAISKNYNRRKRLNGKALRYPRAIPVWDRSVVWATLKNPAYKGTAAFGKTQSGPFKPQKLRPQRGRPQHPRRPVSRVDTASDGQILIDVPAIVDEALFAAVQAELAENRRRQRARPQRGRYLLQGRIVCKRCGYGCYGKPTSRASAKGRIPYASYRCTGSDAYRFGGQRLCWNKQVRTDLLDAAVWEDVRSLLSEPERIRAEYDRRRQEPKPDGAREVDQVAKLIKQVKKSISRLIDAYEEGLLEKSEFEPRISTARERLSRLEEERKRTAAEESRESGLRLVIGQLEEFARRVSEGLREPDWETQREIIRALVKQVEVDEGEIRIVYRVSPSPFEHGPQQGHSQHCWGRGQPDAFERLPALRAAQRVRAGGATTPEGALVPDPLRGRRCHGVLLGRGRRVHVSF